MMITAKKPVKFENSANMNTIIWAQLFEYSNNLNIRGNTD